MTALRSIANDVLAFIPIGEGCAENAKAIWTRMDLHSPATIKRLCDELVQSGHAFRRKQSLTGLAWQWLYWKSVHRSGECEIAQESTARE